MVEKIVQEIQEGSGYMTAIVEGAV